MQQQTVNKTSRLTSTDYARNEEVKLLNQIEELKRRVTNSRSLMNQALFKIPCRIKGHDTITLHYDAGKNMAAEYLTYYIQTPAETVFANLKKIAKQKSEKMRKEQNKIISTEMILLNVLEYELSSCNTIANKLANFRATIHSYVIDFLEENVTSVYKENVAKELQEAKLQTYGQEILQLKFGKVLIDL